MDYRVLFLGLLVILVSCSNEGEDSSNLRTDQNQLIQSYHLSNESAMDSLFYEDNKLMAIKEYIGKTFDSPPSLDYTISYRYDESQRLVEISRMHAQETAPSTTITYGYNTNGTLKNKTITTLFSESTVTYTYKEGQIVVNAGKDSERRIYLNDDNLLDYVEEYGGEIDGFYTVKTYVYDENANISRILLTDRNKELVFQYDMQYDTNPNPFRVFDHLLPNGLSIKMIEDAEQNFGNYHELPYSFSFSDPWGYFNKNNLTSCTVSGAENFDYRYQYQYNEMNLPVEAEFQFWSNQILHISYK